MTTAIEKTEAETNPETDPQAGAETSAKTDANAGLPGLTVFGAAAVRRCIEQDRPGCVAAVRDAYLAHHAGDSVNPPSSFLRFPDRPRDRIIALPAYLGGERAVSGIKWIASFPDNRAAGIPRASAVLVLNDDETGYPTTVLEASVVSATRTAASAVLCAELARPERSARQVGIIGTGLISRHVLAFLADCGWDVEGFRLHDLEPAHAEQFAATVRDRFPDAEVQVASDVREAIVDSDLVVLATVAGAPHITDPAWFAHAPVVLHLSLRDLGPDVIRAAVNVTDDVDHALREGTSLQLAAAEQPDRAFLAGTIGGLIEGTVPLDANTPVIFSPFGLGILDLAVGQWVLGRVPRAEATWVPDFFDGVKEL